MNASMMMPNPPATTIAALSEVMKIETGCSPPWRERGLVSVSMGDLIAEGATADKAAGLRIEVDALLIMAPAPERLRLRTTIDLDNGRARTETRGA